MAISFITAPADTSTGAQYSGNPIWFNLASSLGFTDTLWIDCTIEADIYDGNGYQQIAVQRENCYGGEAQFYVQEIIHQRLKSITTLQGYGTPTPGYNFPFGCKVKCTFMDYADGVAGGAASVHEMYVCKGGLHEQKMGVSYLNYWQPNNKAFLTWKPNNCTVSILQQEYIYWRYFGTIPFSSYTVEWRVFTTAGTTHLRSDGGVNSIIPNGLLVIPVGWGQTGLNTLLASGEQPAWYEVWVKSGGSPISEVRRYYVDQFPRYNERFFHFENSLGGFDTARFIGDAEIKSDVTDEDAKRLIPFSNNGQGNNVRFNSIETHSMKVNTGHLLNDKAELEWLRDLRLSNYVWEDRDGMFVPVRSISKSLSLGKDDDFLKATQFEFASNFSTRFYTPFDVTN
jgi:hypothetical protein